jgi:hypothetical protein
MDDLKEKAAILKKEIGLNLLPTLTRLEQVHTCKGGMLEI